MRARPIMLILVAVVSCLSFPSPALAQADRPEETESERRMAMMMAMQMDEVWDASPEAGSANVRILMTRDGAPFAGIVSIYTEFSFQASGRAPGLMNHSQGMNPNQNGRWVYEGLPPGAYLIRIEGAERFEGFEWERELTVEAGDAPILEVELPEPA